MSRSLFYLSRMKHQGERVDLTCSQVGNKLAGKKSSELLAEQVGQSKNQIFRFIRLTELIPELLDMVDEKKIALNPAYAPAERTDDPPGNPWYRPSRKSYPY